MLLNNSLTLVVVTRDRLIRADFPSLRAAEPSSLAVRDRPHIDDPRTLVEMALAAERRKPGRVYVLSCDVWTHTLAIAAASTHGLSRPELLQTLAFEAEPLSGLSAFDTVTEAVSLGESAGQRTYWVTQVGATVREQIHEAVRTAGGRLAGILHPGGVPQTLEARPPIALTGRIEFWPGATIRTVTREGVVTRSRIDDSGSAAAWLAAVEAWKTESGAAQTMAVVSEGALPVDAADDEFLTLSDDVALRRWLTAWRRTLVAKEPGVPLVAPSVKPLSKQQRMSIAAVLALVALGGCWAHNRWIDSELAAVASEKKMLEAPGEEVAAIKTRFTAMEKDRTTVTGERDKLLADVKQTEEVFDSHRRRLPELMRRLADDSSHDWVLQRIDGTGREIKLTGTTMHPEHISILAEGMSTDLSRLGWTVDPPKQQARNLRDDGGPWQFELRLHDVSPLKVILPPTAPTGTPLQGTVVGAGLP